MQVYIHVAEVERRKRSGSKKRFRWTRQIDGWLVSDLVRDVHSGIHTSRSRVVAQVEAPFHSLQVPIQSIQLRLIVRFIDVAN